MTAATETGLPPLIQHRAEMELFRLTARGSMSAAAEQSLDDLLGGNVDWGHVLGAGGAHGILPLMHLHLARRETVPPVVREAIRDRSERVARSNLYLSTQLLEIVGGLEAAGISTLVFKGPAAAAGLYGNLFLREFGDLDILVKSADVPRATGVIESMGFAPWRLTAGAQEELLQHVEYSRTFTRPSDDLDLDLHWNLARDFFRGRVEAEALWADTTSFVLHGKELRCLSPKLFMLALCVHGAKHGPFPWPRLKWICDVAEFVRQSEGFDWEATVRRAGELGCRRTMLLGLAVSRPLHDDRLPASVEDELAREPQIASLAARIWRWLASDTPVALSFTEHVAVDIALIDDGVGRLSYAARRVFTPTKKDWAARRLPRRFAFLYVPLRLTRLAGYYVPAPWRLRRLLRRNVSRS